MDDETIRDVLDREGKRKTEKMHSPDQGSAQRIISPSPSDELTLDTVEEAFRYHRWNDEQADRGAQVRDALVLAAKIILRVVPRCPARTRALNHLQDARMLANHAITHNGRF